MREGGWPVGVALWLLAGGTLVDRVAWAVRQGFTAVSLLQGHMELDRGEAGEAAAAMREAGLCVTYHGNVHHRLTPAGTLDDGFIDAMIDDVLFWHAHAGGVWSCCSDTINLPVDGVSTFMPALNRALMARLHAGLHAAGVRVGLENVFGGPQRYRTAADVARFAAEAALPGLGTLLDAGHANIHVRSAGVAGEEEIGAFVHALPLDILEVHLSDNHGARDEHRALGTGNLDLPALLAALRAHAYTGPLTLEICRDILNGQYAFDITVPGDTDPVLRSREVLGEAILAG